MFGCATRTTVGRRGSRNSFHGPFNHYTARTSSLVPGQPRGLFLSDNMGLETISGNNVVNFFT
jgi:hypothetical protein